eukprot:1153886-Pelagomonas_calceolata.AAC.1
MSAGEKDSNEETLLLGLAIGIPVGVVFLLALVSLVLLILRRNRKVEEEGGRNASKVAPEGGVPSAPPLSDGWAHPLPPPMLLPGSNGSFLCSA